MGWLKNVFQGLTQALPVIGPVAQEIFSHSRAGYESSPQKRAFNDSVKQEQRIFERDSAYASPAAQMQRFKDAGLNPNLIYGQGTPGNVSGTATQASGNISKLDVIAQILQGQIMQKEIDLKDAQIEQTKANTELLGSRSGSENVKTERMRQDYQYLEQRYPELMHKLRRENEIGDATKEKVIEKTNFDVVALQNQIANQLKALQLMDKDNLIRDEILKSKQFQNALLEIQAKFVKEGIAGPQQMWQALLMLLNNATK